MAQAVWRLAMDWTVGTSNPGRGEIFHTHPDWPAAQTASYTLGTGAFPGGKSTGAWR